MRMLGGRWARFGIVVTMAACGNTSATPADGGASQPDAAGPSLDAGDAGSDASSTLDSGGDAIATTDSGATSVRIVSGTKLHLRGVTSDGYVLYDDSTNLMAVALAGGSPTMVAALQGKNNVAVRGKVAFFWTNEDAMLNGSLGLWTAAAGYHAGVATGSTGSFAPSFEIAAASADGARVLFRANYNATTNVSDWIGASSDGSNVQTLYTGNTCVGRASFAGQYAIWAACDAMQAHALSWYDATWSLIGAKSGFFDWSSDSANTKIFLVGGAKGELDALDGSSSTPLAIAALRAQLTLDASAVFFVDGIAPTTLSRTTVAGATTTPLVTGIPGPIDFSGADGFPTSPDRNWAALVSLLIADGGSGYSSELRVASTSTASTPQPVTVETGSVFFTRDSSHAAYRRTGANGSSLYTLGTVSAGAESKVADAVYTGKYTLDGVYAAHDGDILFVGNYVAGSSTTRGKGDVSVANTSNSAAPVVLAAGAFVPAMETSDGTRAVYATEAIAGAEGIYAVAIP